MKIDEQLLTYSITEISTFIKEKKVSPVQLATLLLNRMDTVDPLINSFITVDHQEVLKQAKRAEEEINKGMYKGPLHGIAIGLKDLINTKNLRTTMGSDIYKDHIPNDDALVVQKLKSAGAIVIGKQNTHQFAYGPTGDRSFFGPVKNPYNLKKMSGGSSSGSGASVTACLCYGSIGTDTGGSIRIPSSFCGIVGMKPTYNLISSEGVFPLSPTLDHVGPMTRSVADNALLLNAISSDEIDYSSELGKDIRGMRIGIPSTFFFEGIDDEIATNMERTISLLQELGAIIAGFIEDIELSAKAYQAIIRSDAYAIHEQRLEKFPNQWDDEVKERLLTALETKGYEYVQALKIRERLKKSFHAVLQEVDVILTPSVAILPPNLNSRYVQMSGEKEQHIRWSILKLTIPTNLTGLPSITIPSGFSTEGMPIGVQFIGRAYDESLLYSAGYALEQALQVHTAKLEINEN